jgi:hypothetical protein
VKRFILILLGFALVYIGSYTWFRSTHIERWDRDGRDVIFPLSSVLYYFYRPLIYIDPRITGISFPIGPHR